MKGICKGSVLVGASVRPLDLPLTVFPTRLLVPRFLGRIGKKMLEDELYLLIQRPMFTFGKMGELILEPVPNSEQQSSPAFWHFFGPILPKRLPLTCDIFLISLRYHKARDPHASSGQSS